MQIPAKKDAAWREFAEFLFYQVYSSYLSILQPLRRRVALCAWVSMRFRRATYPPVLRSVVSRELLLRFILMDALIRWRPALIYVSKLTVSVLVLNALFSRVLNNALVRSASRFVNNLKAGNYMGLIKQSWRRPVYATVVTSLFFLTGFSTS